MGRGCRPQRHRSWYSTFAPFPDTCPRNQPALAQTYATIVSGELMDDSNRSTGGRFRPQAWPPLSAVSQITVYARSTLPCGRVAGSSCNGRHKLSADILAHPRRAQHKQRHVVTLRYEASAEREARDTRTGLAAEPLVRMTNRRRGIVCDGVCECCERLLVGPECPTHRRQRHRGRVPGNVWSAGDEVPYIPGKICQVSAVAC